MCLRPSVCLLWRNEYLGLGSIVWVGFLFLLSSMNCLYILEIKPSFASLFADISSHSIVFFHFVYGFLCCAEACKFD